MAATIKDVALKSGFSIKTVSRVINDEQVNIRTKRIIQKVIDELGYHPNLIARSLKARKSNTIGFIIPDITNPSFPEVVRGASDYIGAKGYYVLLCCSDGDPDKEEAFIRDFNSMLVSGLIVIPSITKNRDISVFNKLKMPVIILDREISGINRDIIKFDDIKGATKAINLLISNGCKNIVLLSGPIYTKTSQDRLKASRKLLEENRLFHEEQVFCGDFSINSGYEMMKVALNKLENIDGVFAFNDLIAIGAIKAIEEKKLRVPDDISIVGFDDINFIKFTKPRLTTIRCSTYDLGRMGAEILVNRINNPGDFKPIKKILDCELIIRDTVLKR